MPKDPLKRAAHLQKMREIGKTVWGDPELRSRASISASKRWENAEQRAIARDNAIKQFEDPEQRRKNSEAQKKRFEDPLEREKISKTTKAAMSNPDIKNKMHIANKKRWLNPEERIKNSERQKIAQNNPDIRHKKSEITKKYFEDPNNRKKASDAAKKLWENPEYCKRNNTARAEAFKRPEVRARMCAAQKMAQSNPDTIQKQKDSRKKTLRENPEIVRKQKETYKKTLRENPEIRQRNSENQKALWKNSEYRERMRNAHKTPEYLQMVRERYVGGFIIQNVRYDEKQKSVYCELWKEVNPRVHAFFDYKCVECGEPETTHSHIGHHVFYVKEACCWQSEDGIYWTNLNAPDHPEKDYCIGENPNYFVILCSSCHGRTNGKFANRKKWADHFKNMIDADYGGKCYFTKEEMVKLATD